MESYNFPDARLLLPRTRRRVAPHLRMSRARVLLMVLVSVGILVCLANGYGWCIEMWNWDGKRVANDGKRWPSGDGVVITYVNGIFHTKIEWEVITGKLQEMFCHEVRPFYNPSSGWWITDASKAGYHMLRRPSKDAVVLALGRHLAQAVTDAGRGRVLHIAHSGGALLTYLAAQYHLTPRERGKIDVLTFGGARSLTRKYFSGRVVNYYARNDPLVMLDRRAAELMRLTNDSNFQAVNDKHNSTFIFLAGRAKHFVQDHSLEGPTYEHALRREASAFRRSHFGLLSPLAWEQDRYLFDISTYLSVRYVRKYMARLTGIRGFFSGKVEASPSSPAVELPGAASVDGVRPGYVPGSATTAAPGGTPYVEGLTRSAARRFRWSTLDRRSDGYNGTPSVTIPMEGTPGTTQPGSPRDTAPGSSASPSGESSAGFWYRGTQWWRPWGSGVNAGAPSIETIPTVATDVGEASADDGELVEVAGAPGWGVRTWAVWYPYRQSWRNLGWGREARPEARTELADLASPEAQQDREAGSSQASEGPASMEHDIEDGSLRGAPGRPWSSMAWIPWRWTRGSGKGEEAPVLEETEFHEALLGIGDTNEGLVAPAEAGAEAHGADGVAPLPQQSWSRRWWPGSASGDASKDVEIPDAESHDDQEEGLAEDLTGEEGQDSPSASAHDRNGTREQEPGENSEKLTEEGEVAAAAGVLESTVAEAEAGAPVPDATLGQLQSLLRRWWTAPGPQQAPAGELQLSPTDVVLIDAVPVAETFSGEPEDSTGAPEGSTQGEILQSRGDNGGGATRILDESSSGASAAGDGLRSHMETPSEDDRGEASSSPWRSWLTFRASSRAPPPRFPNEGGDGDPTRENEGESESSPSRAGVGLRSQDDEQVTGEIFLGAEAYDMLAEATPGSDLYGLLDQEAYQTYPIPETGRLEHIASQGAAQQGPTSDEDAFEACGSGEHERSHDDACRPPAAATDAVQELPGTADGYSGGVTSPSQSAGADESRGRVDAGFVHEDEANGTVVPGEVRAKEPTVPETSGAIDASVGGHSGGNGPGREASGDAEDIEYRRER